MIYYKQKHLSLQQDAKKNERPQQSVIYIINYYTAQIEDDCLHCSYNMFYIHVLSGLLSLIMQY